MWGIMMIDWQLLALVWVKLAGVWILSDAVYSLLLYLPTDQSWIRDHWVRALRGGIGIVMILFG